MKSVFLVVGLCFCLSTSFAQGKKKQEPSPDPTNKIQVVDAACGECKFGLKGKGCDLAVRINGKSYFVDGTDIDSHGDAHAKDGFCNSIRKAEVQGEIVGNRFKASYFKLVKVNGN